MFLSSNKRFPFNLFAFLLFNFYYLNAFGFGDPSWTYYDNALKPTIDLLNIKVTNVGVENYYIKPTYGNSNSGSTLSEINSNRHKLLYSHNITLHQHVKKTIVDYFKGIAPEFSKELNNTDLINIYQTKVASLMGFDQYSVSDASAFLWLQAYLAVNYKEPPFVPEKQIKAVSEQFKIIAVNAEQHKWSNADKQKYAEVLIHQGMLIALGYDDAIKNNNQTALENIARAARASVTGIDQFTITDEGFDRIKEKLSATGSPMTDVYASADSMTINEYISEPKAGIKNLIAIKTATNDWFQCQGKNHCFAWDRDLSSLVDNPIQQLDGVIKMDIFDSLDLSAYSSLFPITVYIGRIDSNNQLHYGYFQVNLL